VADAADWASDDDDLDWLDEHPESPSTATALAAPRAPMSLVRFRCIQRMGACRPLKTPSNWSGVGTAPAGSSGGGAPNTTS